MTQTERGEAFRRLHEEPGAFVIPNPWDAGAARILAGLGFQALATTSSGLAWTLGRRDGQSAVSREEALRSAASIVEATPLPVSADLENGFGDSPEAAAETVLLAAEAGLVGCSIEDATMRPDDPIYPFDLAVERVAAAVEAARSLSFPFTLTARAENFLHGRNDMEDTLNRLRAFEAAGADVLYAPGLGTIDDIRTVCSAVSRPVNVLTNARFTVADLAAAGAKRISLGGAYARVALGALVRAATEARDQGTFTALAGATSMAEIEGFMENRG
jgi:2-methylisocitrate lyase-like PEP mutase family enzyme